MSAERTVTEDNRMSLNTAKKPLVFTTTTTTTTTKHFTFDKKTIDFRQIKALLENNELNPNKTKVSAKHSFAIPRRPRTGIAAESTLRKSKKLSAQRRNTEWTVYDNDGSADETSSKDVQNTTIDTFDTLKENVHHWQKAKPPPKLSMTKTKCLNVLGEIDQMGSSVNKLSISKAACINVQPKLTTRKTSLNSFVPSEGPSVGTPLRRQPLRESNFQNQSPVGRESPIFDKTPTNALSTPERGDKSFITTTTIRSNVNKKFLSISRAANNAPEDTVNSTLHMSEPLLQSTQIDQVGLPFSSPMRTKSTVATSKEIFKVPFDVVHETGSKYKLRPRNDNSTKYRCSPIKNTRIKKSRKANAPKNTGIQKKFKTAISNAIPELSVLQEVSGEFSLSHQDEPRCAGVYSVRIEEPVIEHHFSESLSDQMVLKQPQMVTETTTNIRPKRTEKDDTIINETLLEPIAAEPLIDNFRNWSPFVMLTKIDAKLMENESGKKQDSIQDLADDQKLIATTSAVDDYGDDKEPIATTSAVEDYEDDKEPIATTSAVEDYLDGQHEPIATTSAAFQGTFNSTLNKNEYIKIYSPSKINDFKLLKGNKVQITYKEIERIVGENNRYTSIDKKFRIKIDARGELIYFPSDSAATESLKKGEDFLCAMTKRRTSMLAVMEHCDH